MRTVNSLMHRASEAVSVTKASRESRDIFEKLRKGQTDRGKPHKSGKPLSGDLAGCRRIPVGGMRIIHQVDLRAHRVVILANGARRQEEVYRLATRR
jgi:mRNA-degrading endonuclease RelE of RelBE toxin-antitoxin system